MNWPAQCAAIIPCLDEAKTIREVVAGVRRFLPRVYVVDDGSGDASGALAAEAGATVISHAHSLGKGAALQAGLIRAGSDGFAWAVTLDGDGQHRPADLPRFLDAAEAGADLVVGNRMTNSRGMPLIRLAVNRWMSRRLSALARLHLPDSQCGYRLLRLGACSGLHFGCRHFEFESEMLLAFARAQRRVDFVEIETIYREERSKIRPFLDTCRWFRWWLRAQTPRIAQAPVTPVLPATLAQAVPDRG